MRCLQCAVTDQLQCVLDAGHESDCMFAEWPYRTAPSSSGAATPIAVTPEIAMKALSEISPNIPMKEREYAQLLSIKLNAGLLQELQSRAVSATPDLSELRALSAKIHKLINDGVGPTDRLIGYNWCVNQLDAILAKLAGGTK